MNVAFSSIDEAKECLKDYEQSIKVGDSLKRLLNDPDFKELILDGFCSKLCAEYVARSVNSKLSKEVRELALSAAQAGGHLSNYINILKYKADTANDNIEEVRRFIDNQVIADNNTEEV